MKFFRSTCRIQTPSRLASYTGGGGQIAEQEILIVVASLVVHCCAIKKNVIDNCCITVIRYCRCAVHSRVQSRLSMCLQESRLSHRPELLFNLCGNKGKTMWNPIFTI